MLKKLIIKRFPAIVLALLFSCQLQAQATEGQATAAQAAQAVPENVPALLMQANQAYLAKDHMAFAKIMKQIHTLRPYNSDYMYQLVMALALLDQKSAAYDQMLRMQRQGLSYDFLASDDSMNIRGTEVFDYVNDLMKMAANPVGEAEPVFTLPVSVSMPEAISWDETRQKFLIGTITDGGILAVGEDGETVELLKANKDNGMWSVFDILVDAPANRLWVTSAASPGFKALNPADKGQSALFEFNLETLELVQRHPVPADGKPHNLGNMVLSPTGDIFIVDRALPIVYKLQAGQEQIKPLLASREMVSMRGIAMQPDGNLMYLADRELGILVVDLKKGVAGKLVVPETLNLGGIEGLYLWENHLIVIQNGIKPQRVMRLELDAAGTSVTAVRPLGVAMPGFDYPSYGVVRGKDLYFYANSQWPGGPSERKPVTVVRTTMDSSGDLEQPDMADFLKQRAENIKAQQQKD
jgi:hypothetical protein